MPNHSLTTKLVSVVQHNDQHGSSVPPIYQSTTFKIGSLEDDASQTYDYTRSGNPTRTVVQHQLAKLYDVDSSQVLAVSSGMTALDMILRGLVLNNASSVPMIVAGDDLYGGTQRLLTHLGARNHARVLHVDTTNYDAFVKAFNQQPRVDCVLLESPTNPLLKVADLPRLAKFIKHANPDCVVAVDNTMMSGMLCNPLHFNCDVVYESATKYLNGHHDIMAGVIIAKTPKIAGDIYFVINSTGCGLSPLDSWLLIRGLKTLGIRIYQQQHNAMVLAHWLEASCGFRKRNKQDLTQTRYVGLKSHPQFELHKSFNAGPGALLSFETGSFEHSRRLVSSRKLKLWSVTVSFGCVNSLISMPGKMSHAAIDPALRQEREFPEDLIRLCCGIESVADLQADLLEAMVESDIIELRDEGRTIYNKLNGNLASNTIGQGELPNIYEEFFGQNGIKRHCIVTSRAKL
ncbi:LAME_0H16182g1_1 [Lachancea meyersii CBS 8951]|uniref:cysteine-S-conjugate beta-lyase n=1 Tax=Lachancea meyersii CBS 8951 TaxID=1266667 RepID=A0A1G4KI32_9SACH|nr:LAME_0H16182g1_1 [Lachancea meyersii CBS 8951]